MFFRLLQLLLLLLLELALGLELTSSTTLEKIVRILSGSRLDSDGDDDDFLLVIVAGIWDLIGFQNRQRSSRRLTLAYLGPTCDIAHGWITVTHTKPGKVMHSCIVTLWLLVGLIIWWKSTLCAGGKDEAWWGWVAVTHVSKNKKIENREAFFACSLVRVNYEFDAISHGTNQNQGVTG